jgi:hypothetical protein
MADTIKITILADGTIKTETDKVSAVNHSNAESFLTRMATLCGGAISRVLRPGAKAHTHTHDHQHAGHGHGHDGHTH